MNDMKQKDDTMRVTPETDAEWDRLQMQPGAGYGGQVTGVKVAFGMARWAENLEHQRDEARRLALELRDALKQITDQDAENFELGYQALGPLVVQVARNALIKAKEVLGEA